MSERYLTDGGPDYDQSAHSHRFTYDVDRDESPSQAVVRAVAAVTNTPPLDIDPLHDAIEPDTLNRALETSGRTDVETEVTFAFGGCEVTATPDEVRIVDVETDG